MPDFVTVRKQLLHLGKNPFYFVGANAYNLMVRLGVAWVSCRSAPAPMQASMVSWTDTHEAAKAKEKCPNVSFHLQFAIFRWLAAAWLSYARIQVRLAASRLPQDGCWQGILSTARLSCFSFVGLSFVRMENGNSFGPSNTARVFDGLECCARVRSQNRPLLIRD